MESAIILKSSTDPSTDFCLPACLNKFYCKQFQFKFLQYWSDI